MSVPDRDRAIASATSTSFKLNSKPSSSSFSPHLDVVERRGSLNNDSAKNNLAKFEAYRDQSYQ